MKPEKKRELPYFILFCFLLVVMIAEIPNMDFQSMTVWEIFKAVLMTLALIAGIIIFLRR